MAEPAYDAELLCRACTSPHYGDKVDLLGTPDLTELYIRLSASNINVADSLPKQICSACYQRLDDLNRFQQMCSESYSILLQRFPQFEILKQEAPLTPFIKDENPEYLIAETLVELPPEEVDFIDDQPVRQGRSYDGDDEFTTVPVGADDDTDDEDDDYDRKDSDYDPFEDHDDDDNYDNNTASELDETAQMTVDAKPAPRLENDSVVAPAVKKPKRGRPKKVKEERLPSVVKKENDDGDGESDDRADVDETEEEGTLRKGRRRHNMENAERVEKVKSEPFACTKCPKKFYKKERYEAHTRQHEGLKPYACPHCHKQYSKALRLKNHITNEHSENPMRFNCTFEGCGKVYRNRESLNWHVNTHFNPPKPVDKADRPIFICELCGKALSSRGVLRKHTMIHTNEYPFVCDICPRKYRTQDRLNLHKMRHKGIKNHECPICGLKKTTGHELNVHMNVHTRAKKFPCNLCNACFLNNGNLVRHIRVVHEGIKTYSCTYCDQSFGKAETLKHHVMRHTGEKPHECPICGKRFIQKTSFQLHVKRHDKAKNGEKTRVLKPVADPPPPSQAPPLPLLPPPPMNVMVPTMVVETSLQPPQSDGQSDNFIAL